MTKILKSALLGAALLGTAMTGSAVADGTSPAFPFAATGFLSGGGSWLEADKCGGPGCESDIATIVGGGDFVIPVTGYWNIQLGGAWRWDETSLFFGSMTNTQFQGGGIGFWRDPAMGLFGIEAGLYSSSEFSPSKRVFDFGQDYVKLGGVAEYYFSDMVTIGGFGGVLIPTDSTPFGSGGTEIDDGFYAGGQLTYYATDNFAFSAIARFMELNVSNPGFDSRTQQALHVGGEVRYLTAMSGVEFFAYGGYSSCEEEFSRQGQSFSSLTDGAEVLGGIRIHLGGRDGRLVDIDRSNSLDTRAWSCAGIRGGFM